MKTKSLRRFGLLALVTSAVACSGGSGGRTGAAGTGAVAGTAGTGGMPSPGAAGSAAAGTGAAGMTTGAAGTSGAAGTMGAAGTGLAGMSAAGANGAAGTGQAGITGAAGKGAAGMAGAAGTGGRPSGGCTDAVLRTAPPAGKETFKTEPVDTVFPFAKHWIGAGSGGPIGITGMGDFDHDGDLDFSSGQRGGPEWWWEYCSPDHWVMHTVGTGASSPGGGNAMDVDGDGWVDVIAGDSWFRNPKLTAANRAATWTRLPTGVGGGAEDVAVGDANGDGKLDALFVWNSYSPQWRTLGADATMAWTLGAMMQNSQTQGGAIGDLDGDKDNDIVVGNQWWYRNMDGQGKQWETVRIAPANAFDDSPLVNIGDIDGDGDKDLVMCTHFGARAVWVENGGGTATTWTVHPLATGKNQLHAIFPMDFDNDGDLDVYGGESSGTAWIWENDGKGNFKEHAAAMNARGHDARVGDVDCDGDLDIVGKPWDGGTDHVYLRNMTVERGGKAVFTRPSGEVWRAGQTADHCP